MSAGRSVKSQSFDVKSRAKTVLATLERLNSSITPDKEQIRYLSHKLLHLVNDQETSKKDVTNKAGLDIILSTLESCNDQATCLALVSTLSEIANGGSNTIKRLVTHDVTRVLLHTLSYLGAELDWRLLSAIVHLLSKVGPKDRRFALRARLTGSLPTLLSALRSTHNHSSHSRLMPVALTVLRLSIVNSSTNASLLGRAGAINVLFRIVTSLSKKHSVPLKNALATFNLLVRLSKANANRAITLGVVPHLLSMHQLYHKNDFKFNRFSTVRKSVLNVIKNIAVLKTGRRAFLDANGLYILYKSCQDYLEAGQNKKPTDALLVVAIIVMRRCQPKSRLPVATSRCSFNFPLPGGRDRSDSLDSIGAVESDDDFDENEENLSNDDLDDAGETTHPKRRDSFHCVTKQAGVTETLKDPLRPKFNTRSSEDLKMYETYFPELLEFPLPPADSSWNPDFSNRPHTSGEVEHSLKKLQENRHSLPDLGRLNSFMSQTREYPPVSWSSSNITSASTLSNDLRMLGLNDMAKNSILASKADPTPSRRSLSSTEAVTDFLSINYSSGDDQAMGGQKQESTSTYYSKKSSQIDEPRTYEVPPYPHHSSVHSFLSSTALSFDDCDVWSENEFDQKNFIDQVQKVAAMTKSMKEPVNQLSAADAWGCTAVGKSEFQVNKKQVQRLIKSKVLEDIGRTLFPSNVIMRLVYSVDYKELDRDSMQRHSNTHITKCEVFESSEPSNEALSPVNEIQPDADSSSSSSLDKRYLQEKFSGMSNHDVESSSTTVSDETWPGAYLENFDSNNNNNLPGSSNLVEDDLYRENEASSSHKTNPLPLDACPPLKFDSHFESGNLRSAMQVREFEYDLILTPDCNSNHHFQWFYFEVSGMKAAISYRFNIINCEKKGSAINEGMQPVMYSMAEARLGRPCWVRVGRDTCYYRNNFLRNHTSAGGVKGRTYFTLTFTVTFKYANDICYFAYHYPYTYTKLQLDLKNFTQSVDPSTMYVRTQTFCHTLGGNPVPLLTITAPPSFDGGMSEREAIEEMQSRPYIFLTARVHPGESNASWTMRGTLRLLLTPPPRGSNEKDETLAAVAHELRRSYIFKIVPMLNPDGVINGHHRCSLTGEDLNRTWSDPTPELFPTIYHTKGLLQYLQMIQKAPLVYCDYHGHSRRMNVFLYGCSHRESVAAGETSSIHDGPDDTGYKTLPKLLNHFAPPFSLKNCSFVVEKAKVSTARVVVWKEIGVARSYTMESTYCGCDQGALRGKQIGTSDLEAMGSKFCEVLLHLKVKNRTRGLPVYDSDDESSDKPESNASASKENQSDHMGPGCPVNSDAELTPDDDISALDEAYGVAPAPLRNDNKLMFSYMLEARKHQPSPDMAFWRYDPLSGDEVKVPVREDGSSDSSNENTSVVRNESSGHHHPRPVSRKPLPLITARVSPVTGRVLSYEYEHDDPPATAPRPFESGSALKRVSVSAPSDDEPVTGPSCSTTEKHEGSTARSRRRASRHRKD